MFVLCQWLFHLIVNFVKSLGWVLAGEPAEWKVFSVIYSEFCISVPGIHFSSCFPLTPCTVPGFSFKLPCSSLVFSNTYSALLTYFWFLLGGIPRLVVLTFYFLCFSRALGDCLGAVWLVHLCAVSQFCACCFAFFRFIVIPLAVTNLLGYWHVFIHPWIEHNANDQKKQSLSKVCHAKRQHREQCCVSAALVGWDSLLSPVALSSRHPLWHYQDALFPLLWCFSLRGTILLRLQLNIEYWSRV